jgi:nucleotide-binding universal stress UspA family protein
VLNVLKLKILVPLDGTEKSMHSLNWLKKFYSSEDVEVTLLHVIDVVYSGEMVPLNLADSGHTSSRILEKAEKELPGYKVNKLSIWGHISDEILKEAKDGKYNMIVMAKSSVKGISRIIGSVTTKVVRNSEVAVIVVPE